MTHVHCTCRAVGPGGGGAGARSPQFLADQLTLSQPDGQIMPTTLLLAPPTRFSDLPTSLHIAQVELVTVASLHYGAKAPKVTL